jgi:hypothetical protein
VTGFLDLCMDVLDQDGWQGRCTDERGHDGPHHGLCVRAEASEVADLNWTTAEQSEPT